MNKQDTEGAGPVDADGSQTWDDTATAADVLTSATNLGCFVRVIRVAGN